jgi:hypothetical protein
MKEAKAAALRLSAAADRPAGERKQQIKKYLERGRRSD